jgi:hypothetical protein
MITDSPCTGFDTAGLCLLAANAWSKRHERLARVAGRLAEQQDPRGEAAVETLPG